MAADAAELVVAHRRATVERRYWGVPPIFTLIQDRGNIDAIEMHRTFNMGIGMVLIVAKERGMDVMKKLEECGETAYIIGEVHKEAAAEDMEGDG